MKGSRVRFSKAMLLAVSFAGVLGVWGTATSSAAVIMIDDFSSPTLSPEYVQSTTFMGNGTVMVTFDATTNPGKLTASQTTTATSTWQVALLRDDYRLLHDGDWVQVTTNINPGSDANSQFLGGLYLNTKGATSNSPQFQMVLRGNKGLATTAGNVSNAVANLTDPVILRATRVSATSLRASYSVNGGETFTQIGNAVTVPDVSAWGVGVQLGNLNVPTLVGTISFDNLQMNDVSLAQGDFDRDGDVDGADFIAWQTHLPLSGGATLANGDADGDGDVDGADFGVWQSSFPLTPGPGTSPIPEPSAFILSIFGIAAACFAAKRQRCLHGLGR